AKGNWSAPVSVDSSGGVPNVINTVTCPSVSLCVAGDASGNVLASARPTGGAGAWSVSNVDGWPITGIACPPQNTCAAVDGWGGVLLGTSSISTNPGPPGPPVRNTARGRLVVVGHVKVLAGPKLRVRVACRGPLNVVCTGRLTLLTQIGRRRHRRKVGLGGVAIKLRGGRTRTITAGLDPRGRRLLKVDRRLRVRLAITQGKRSVLNRLYVLRRAAPHRRGKPGSHRPGKPGSHRPGKPGSRRPGKPTSRRPGRPTSGRPGKPRRHGRPHRLGGAILTFT
ncbi:MAG: hypothetical protein ACJ780_12505, partial [Solirubrobacteraceae bacterium]